MMFGCASELHCEGRSLTRSRTDSPSARALWQTLRQALRRRWSGLWLRWCGTRLRLRLWLWLWLWLGRLQKAGKDLLDLGGVDVLRLLELVLIDEAVAIEVGLEEFPQREGRQLDAIDHAVLVGVDLAELALRQLLADLVGQQILGLRSVGRASHRHVFLQADLAVAVLVEPIGVTQLHVDQVGEREQALATLRLGLLPLGGLALQGALHDQAQLGFGDLVVAIRVVLVEFGMDRRLGFGALDEAVAVGVERIELGTRAIAPVLDTVAARHVGGVGWLGEPDEFIERELAVLVGVERFEHLHSVLQE